MELLEENILRRTDIYKTGHLEQYCPGTSYVYSYLTARNNDRLWDRTLFFGLQYYLKKYLVKPITPEMGEEFLFIRKHILGSNSRTVENKIRDLCKLGYWPLEIKAPVEGSVISIRNALMTVANTKDDFHWAVGFVESLLLKIWFLTTVATHSFKYRTLIEQYFNETVDEDMYFLKDLTAVDFGYRGCDTEESAYVSGGAHLINHLGSDTMLSFDFLNRYYNADLNSPIMLSANASEHSVMCSFGREDELAAFNHMLDLYPTGICSVVSDTYNVWTVLTDFAEKLKSRILSRDGKVVFRPDSGNPEYIICGDPSAKFGTPEFLGAIRLLDMKFGSTINKKGYRILNPKIGLIYGDGMYYERYERTLSRLKNMGYAASNLTIGVGGILRNHSRDTFGFAIKATNVVVNGESRDIEKDPITDHKKKSHKGLMRLDKDENGQFFTKDNATKEEAAGGYLETVFRDGKITKEYTLSEIRERVKSYL